MSGDPASHSLYDVLRALVDRVGWPTEQERRSLHRSISEAERVGILGNLAVDMTCDHPEDERSAGQCLQCGRQIENTAAPAGRDTRYGQTHDRAGRYYRPGRR